MTILAEHGPIKIFPTKLIQPYDMGTPALHKALSNLLKKDLVYKDSDKNNIITDPFLAEWIRTKGNYSTKRLIATVLNMCIDYRQEERINKQIQLSLLMGSND